MGVTGYYASESSTTPSASATGWTSVTSATSYSANILFTLSSGGGIKTVYVWFKDASGNVSTSASGTIAVTTTTSGDGGGGGGGCFIATAAYGSYLDPNVELLRDFRDRHLMTNPAGRAFVSFYYRVSPPVADFISQNEFWRTVTRWTLTPFVYGVKYPSGTIMFVGFSTGILLYRRKAKKLFRDFSASVPL